jgi:hypothetical protein
MASVVAPRHRRDAVTSRVDGAWPPRHRRDACSTACRTGAPSSRNELLLRTMFVYYCCLSSFPASLMASSRDTQTFAVASSGARFK